MDLIDRIHHTRFLGREFLTWLWYRTELQEEIFRLENAPPMMISFDDRLVLEAAVDATEEAIINAMVAAETMVGRDGNRSEALPLDQLQAVLTRYHRLQ